MGSIRKRPDGMWRARYRGPDKRERSQHFARKIDAERWLAGVEVAKARGDWVDPSLSRVAVRDWAATWLSTQRQLKPSTLDRYTGIVDKHITPTLGLVALAELTPALIDEWMTGLHRYGLSAASVRQCHRVLSRMLAYAVRDGRLSWNPAEGADLPRVTPRTKVYLSHAELARLAGECGTYETAVLLLGYSGLRWGEFAALRVRDVDLIRRRVHVQRAMVELRGQVIIGTPKDHEQREVPLPRFLVDPLAQALAGRAADALAFTSPEGAIMRNNNFRRRCFDAAAIRAEVPGITPHGLRHTAASGDPGRSPRDGGLQDARTRRSVDHAAGVRAPLAERSGCPGGPPARGQDQLRCGPDADWITSCGSATAVSGSRKCLLSCDN
jgi:integrase